MQEDIVELPGHDGPALPLQLQTMQQCGVADGQFLGQAQQNDVFGRPIAGKRVELAGHVGLGGLHQTFDQRSARQDGEAFVLDVGPVILGALGLGSVEIECRPARGLDDVAADMDGRHGLGGTGKHEGHRSQQHGHQDFPLQVADAGHRIEMEVLGQSAGVEVGRPCLCEIRRQVEAEVEAFLAGLDLTIEFQRGEIGEEIAASDGQVGGILYLDQDAAAGNVDAGHGKCRPCSGLHEAVEQPATGLVQSGQVADQVLHAVTVADE